MKNMLENYDENVYISDYHTKHVKRYILRLKYFVKKYYPYIFWASPSTAFKIKEETDRFYINFNYDKINSKNISEEIIKLCSNLRNFYYTIKDIEEDEEVVPPDSS